MGEKFRRREIGGRLGNRLFWIRFFFQEWVTATSIRITLNRLNTLGDEIWQAGSGLKSYFYAISDLNIGARFVNNGRLERIRKVGGGNSIDERGVKNKLKKLRIRKK